MAVNKGQFHVRVSLRRVCPLNETHLCFFTIHLTSLTNHSFNNISSASLSPSDASQERDGPDGSVAPGLEEASDKAEGGSKVSVGNVCSRAVGDLRGVSCLCWEIGWCDQGDGVCCEVTWRMSCAQLNSRALSNTWHHSCFSQIKCLKVSCKFQFCLLCVQWQMSTLKCLM